MSTKCDLLQRPSSPGGQDYSKKEKDFDVQREQQKLFNEFNEATRWHGEPSRRNRRWTSRTKHRNVHRVQTGRVCLASVPVSVDVGCGGECDVGVRRFDPAPPCRRVVCCTRRRGSADRGLPGASPHDGVPRGVVRVPRAAVSRFLSARPARDLVQLSRRHERSRPRLFHEEAAHDLPRLVPRPKRRGALLGIQERPPRQAVLQHLRPHVQLEQLCVAAHEGSPHPRRILRLSAMRSPTKNVAARRTQKCRAGLGDVFPLFAKRDIRTACGTHSFEASPVGLPL